MLVANPALLRVACRTPEQMRLVNALCRLVEVAAAQTGAPADALTAAEDPDSRAEAPARDPGEAPVAGAGPFVLFPELEPPDRRGR